MNIELDEMPQQSGLAEQVMSGDQQSTASSHSADYGLGSEEYLDSSNPFEYGSRPKIRNLPKALSHNLSKRVAEIVREGVLGNEQKATGVLSSIDAALNRLDLKEKGKSKAKSRQRDRDLKQTIDEGIREFLSSDDEEQLSVSTYEDDNATWDSSHLAVDAETIVSLRDFALSNLSGRGSTYVWTDEENVTYIQDCFDMLWDIHAQYNGQVPGVAQILLGDLWPIATYEQENEIIGLLDNKRPSFSEEDVAVLLAEIGNDSPLDVISIQNIEDNCVIDDPIALYAALLKTFMKYRVLEHSKDEENDLVEIMEYIEKSYEFLDQEERQEITAKLNIMAIFESGLAAEYAKTTKYGELIEQLSGEITNDEKSVQEAAESLIRQLDNDGALEDEVSTCIGMLEEEGFQSYAWTDEDESEINSQDVINAKSDSESDYSDAEEVEL